MSAPFEIVKKATPMYSKPKDYNTVNQSRQNLDNLTLKGFLMKNYIKKDDAALDSFDSFDYIVHAVPSNDYIPLETSSHKSAFDAKKAIKPVLLAALASIGAIVGISACVAKYSSHLGHEKGLVRPPDLPRNMNVLEEYHLAMYRVLRDPSNKKNIYGLAGVALFSALTLSAKSLVDGAKEVWIKKQNCDIDYDLQENLIEVEKNAFAGKLNTVNTLLANTAEYFKSSISGKNNGEIEFKSFLSFKGKDKPKEETEQEKKINPIIAGILGVIAFGAIFLAVFKNFQKTASNLDNFVDKMTDKDIKDKIEKAVQIGDKDKAVEELSNVLKTINATKEKAREHLKKIEGMTPDEIEETVEKLDREQIFIPVPEALGGRGEKTQYYCYINEERGYFYNWILNPENPWNKYLFLSMCIVSSVGYLAKSAADALKQVTVSRENSKSELNLRRRLVDVEVNNFKAKKLSAINPMIDNFNLQKQRGKSKEELTRLASNILLEIKNGPPYVYN